MSSHLLDSVVSDGKSSVNLTGVSCMLRVLFLLLILKFCLCFLNIFAMMHLSVYPTWSSSCWICRLMFFFTFAKFLPSFHWILFLLPGLFPFLVVLPLWMLMQLVVSFTYLRLYSLYFLSLFLRLHFVVELSSLFTNSSCKHQSTIESFQWISVAVIMVKPRIFILSLFLLSVWWSAFILIFASLSLVIFEHIYNSCCKAC